MSAQPVEVYEPVSRYSDGKWFVEESQPELGEQPVPEPLLALEKRLPFMEWINDRGRFPGDRPTAFVHQGEFTIILSELRNTLMGVLIGKKKPNGRILWRSYRRTDGLTFQESLSMLTQWTKGNQEFPFPKQQQGAA